MLRNPKSHPRYRSRLTEGGVVEFSRDDILFGIFVRQLDEDERIAGLLQLGEA